MEQRDYLQKQIDQLGKVLAKVLTDLLGFKSKGQINDGIETTPETLKTQMDLDLEKLLTLAPDDFLNVLKQDKKLSNEHLNQLAEILFIMAAAESDRSNREKSIRLYEKCLTIYEHLQQEDENYSYNRYLRIKKVKDIFNETKL